MSHITYLDESGDLGFKFTAPYRNGGSSRHLTIAFFICPIEKRKLLKRIVVKTYNKYKFSPSVEIKGSSLSTIMKEDVATKVVGLLNRNPDISIHSITVNKENTPLIARNDANLLYYYMLRLALINSIDTYPSVELIRDNRTVKTQANYSLIDYLRTTLVFEHSSSTILHDKPSDSKQFKNLMLADWMNNIIFGHYEDGNSSPFNILAGKLRNQTLYF